jgi:Asp-tRNA(Asn)/Glu-tRNA(Gln) amidotransferase C subunit
MKKSKIKLKEYLKDLENILELANKVSNFDPETTDINQLTKIVKSKNKQIKNKYKNLDTEK